MIFMMTVIPFLAGAQTIDDKEAIARLTGVVDVEEVDSQDLEMLSDMIHNPIKINSATTGRLEKSGIFTSFQIASIHDYRSRHGDILSLMELSSLDGFSSDIVSRLAPFITLNGGTPVVGLKAVQHDISVRSGVKTEETLSLMYGVRSRVRTGAMTLSVSGSKAYSERGYALSDMSGNISWNHSSGNLIIGDFNARFGQGMCLWNTSQIGGLTAPSAFMRKPSGIAPTFSFTGSSALSGAAGDLSFGRWKVTALVAFPGIKQVRSKPDKLKFMPAVNVTHYRKYGHVALTHMSEISDFYSSSFRIPRMMSSADASVCISGVNLFGEMAYAWVNSSVGVRCGTDWRLTDALRMAALLKYFPCRGFSNEYGAAVSGEYEVGRSRGEFSADASYYPESKSKDGARSVQVKMQTNWEYDMFECLVFKIRISERLRTWGRRTRTDVRLDVKYTSGIFQSAARINVLDCVNTGVLAYCEGGLRGKTVDADIRAGVFRIDDWDDRIYVYERDAPGSYNVPAYYGRGLWLAMNVTWKVNRGIRIYGRASYVGYPFMDAEKRKPGKAELKIQTVFKF